MHLKLRCAFSLFIFLLLSSCSSLYYWPTGALYSDPWEQDISYQNIFFKTLDGTQLHAWHLKHDKDVKKKGLITFFHGNAQNLTSHAPILSWLTKNGYDLFIFDYRGYGLSEGSPSQSGLYQDALSALNFSHDLLENEKDEWILYGQSLGGAVLARALVDFKNQERADLLVLDSTFSSYRNLAREKMKGALILYPFIPLAPFLISDEYASSSTLKDIHTPTLVIHGLKDSIIEAKFGEEIFNKLTTPKWYWALPEGGHIDGFFINKEELKGRFLNFLSQNLKK